MAARFLLGPGIKGRGKGERKGGPLVLARNCSDRVVTYYRGLLEHQGAVFLSRIRLLFAL